MASDGPKQGQEDLFPTNPDLADILGRTDLNFENFIFFDFLDSNFLDFQVPRSPNSQISRFPDFQTPPPDELSDPNLTPLPTHPGIKYVARALAATKIQQVDQVWIVLESRSSGVAGLVKRRVLFF